MYCVIFLYGDVSIFLIFHIANAIYLFTYLLSVKTASVAGRWSAPIFLSAAALLRTECDHVPPPLAVLHTRNMGPVSSWEYVWISGEMLQPRNCVQQWIYRKGLLVMR